VLSSEAHDIVPKIAIKLIQYFFILDFMITGFYRICKTRKPNSNYF